MTFKNGLEDCLRARYSSWLDINHCRCCKLSPTAISQSRMHCKPSTIEGLQAGLSKKKG